MTRWEGCTDDRPCDGDTCDACIRRRIAERRERERFELGSVRMSAVPGRNPLYLVSAFGVRNPVVAWAINHGLSDGVIGYRLQGNDFGDDESLRFAEQVLDVDVEKNPDRYELRS